MFISKMNRLYWTLSIYIISVILIFIPIFSTYFPGLKEHSDGYWEVHFTFTTSIISIPTVVLLINLSLYHLTKTRLMKRVFLLLSFICSGFLFLFASSSLVMPIPDFWASNGLFLLLLLFPIVSVIIYKDFTKKTKS